MKEQTHTLRGTPIALGLGLMMMITAAGCGSSTDDTAGGVGTEDCERDSDCPTNRRCSGGSCVLMSTSGSDRDTGMDEEDAPPSPATVCTACDTDGACGRETDLCVALIDGAVCGRDCGEDPEPCPDGTTCQEVMDGRPGHEGKLQCLPTIGQCTDCYDPDDDDRGSGPGCRATDCDQDDPNTYEGAEEVCDEKDNDCDDDVDEGFDLMVDLDHCGGCGQACAPPNTQEAACVEGACEIVACPEGFGDCDGRLETGCEASLRVFYLDSDGDRFGDRLQTVSACEAPDDYVSQPNDCDDSNPDINPAEREECDGLDNDCSTVVDDNLDPPLAAITTGVCRGATKVCRDGEYVEPDYNELPDYEPIESSCDGLDNDCDGQADLDCDPCLVPLFFATIQEAAEARCSTITIQANAPRNMQLTNPPEAVTLRPERGQPAFGTLTIQLDDGGSQLVRVSTMAFEQVLVTNFNPTAQVILDRLRVAGTRSFAAPISLTGYGLTLRNSTVEDNEATSGLNSSGAISLNVAIGFSLERNIVRNNRVAHNEVTPSRIAGALLIQDSESRGRLIGNLFAGNGANANEGAGAIYIDEGVSDVTLRNNTLVGNTNALNMQASAVACAGELSSGLFSSNIMWDQTGRHVFGCDQAPIQFSLHQGDAPEGTGNLNADPLFADPDNGDYALGEGSPAINAGDPSATWNDVDGSRNDMGHTGGPQL